MRLANAWPAIFFLAMACFAQSRFDGPPDVARARMLLHSAQWADKAWGAYFAGQLQSPDLAPDILDELRSNAGVAAASESSEAYGFIAALFDAAIQTGVQASSAVLEPFEKNWDQPVLILLALSQAGDREESLLRLSDARPDVVWLAANNLLFGMKSQKWYAKTLRELRIGQRFTVIDPGQVPPKLDKPGRGTCGDGWAQMPKDFPPIALYMLETHGAGLVKFAPGPTDVYYRRTVVPTNTRIGVGSCFSVDRSKETIGYLASLAKLPLEKTPLEKTLELFDRETLIRYSGAAEFQAAIQESLSAQEQEVRNLLQAIHQLQELNTSGVVIHIYPQISDRRQNKMEPLPSAEIYEIALK